MINIEGIDNQQEYKLSNGQSISIQRNNVKMKWEVACWNEDDTAHWYKEFDREDEALAEYNRFKP